jgi:hypothetical protein
MSRLIILEAEWRICSSEISLQAADIGLFSDPSTTKNFTPSKVSDCPDLFSNHEEADTRMLLHAIHADTRFGDMNVIWKFFSTVFFPIPKNEDVVSQPVKACTAGNNLHTRGPWIWQISWTGR